MIDLQTLENELATRLIARREPRIVSWLFLIAFGALCGCGAITVKRSDFSEAGQPKIKIVQISDIHFDSTEAIFVEMIETINKTDPDLLVITGDFLTRKGQYESMMHCLGKITLTCPKFAVLGNWEYWSHIQLDDFRARLSKMGVSLLVNEGQVIKLGNRAVQIYGVDDYLGGKPSFNGLHARDEHLNIILAHCPKLFDVLVASDQAGNRNKTMMLSGHTHGGQITFFGLSIKTPVGSGVYSSGLYTNGKDALYVSRGIGNSVVHFRLFSPPTIEIIQL